MKFEHVPIIGKPDRAPKPKVAAERKMTKCADCGKAVCHGVLRCRECYLDEIHRAPVHKKGGSPVAETEGERFARMDAKFCAAMSRAIDAGLERPPEARR